MREAFERVYAEKVWGHGSGVGSAPQRARPYLKLLRTLIASESVRSVVDVGCGDWQLWEAFDCTGIDYTGIDVVPSLIEHHQSRWGSPTVRFRVLDASTSPLPAADLLIVKDVLQHWSNSAVHRFLPVLGQYRLALVTNGIEPWGQTTNREIVDGDCRPLDLQAAPFHLPSTELLQYTGRTPGSRRWPLPGLKWRKSVLLCRG